MLRTGQPRFTTCIGRILALAASASLASAGVITGTVTERQSAHALSRTQVILRPVPTPLDPSPKAIQTRTNRGGGFSFIGIPPGFYTVRAEREGFFPAENAQRRPSGYGRPIEVTEDSQAFIELQMGRVGSISGTVMDENDVGIPHVPVVAYNAELPLRPVANAESDDRGMYRIPGLDTGQYWVRTGAFTLSDRSEFLPTFAREVTELRSARAYQAYFDRETTLAHINPIQGSLFSVAGMVTCDEKNEPITVTLSSELGLKTATTACPDGAPGSYSFNGLAPGDYEIYADYDSDSLVGGGFVSVRLEEDKMVDIQVRQNLRYRSQGQVRMAGGGYSNMKVEWFGKRDDLGGVEVPGPLEMPLPVGYWHLHAKLPPGYYVSSIDAGMRSRGRRYDGQGNVISPQDWFEVFTTYASPPPTIVIGSDPARIQGTVKEGDMPAPGAPVAIRAVDEMVNRQANGVHTTFADTEGHFEFQDLPPGVYYILATFDERDPKLATFEEAQAKTIHLAPSESTDLELGLWLAP